MMPFPWKAPPSINPTPTSRRWEPITTTPTRSASDINWATHVTYDRATNSYHEEAAQPHHSPIWAGLTTATRSMAPMATRYPGDPNSPVRHMVSGFVLRDGGHHTIDLRQTGRHSLAKWAADQHDATEELTSEQVGPDVSTRYPLGRYCEDYDYLGDLGYIAGKEFDLDRYNGRFCVTPDFPQGTYAYFVALDADGRAAFPMSSAAVLRRPAGGNVSKIDEVVTTYRTGGAESPIHVATVKTPDGGARITWNSVEGGHYTVQSSASGSDWTTLAPDVRSQGTETTYEAQAGRAVAGMKQFRVMLASLDPYDNTSAGRRRGPGGPGGPDVAEECRRTPPGMEGPDGPVGSPVGAVSDLQPNTAHPGASITLRITLDARGCRRISYSPRRCASAA